MATSSEWNGSSMFCRVHSRLTAMDTFIYNHQPHTLVEIPSQEGTAEIPSKNLPVHTFSSFNSFCHFLRTGCAGGTWSRKNCTAARALWADACRAMQSMWLSQLANDFIWVRVCWMLQEVQVWNEPSTFSDILCTFDYILFIRVPANVNRFPRVCKWCAVAMRFSITAKCKDQETPMQLLHFVSPYITESLPSSQSNLISQR